MSDKEIAVNDLAGIPEPPPIAVPDLEPAAAPREVLEYDAQGPQKFTFESRDDAGTYRFSHTFAPIGDAAADALLVQFDNERSIEYLTKGKTTDITPNAAAASIRLWAALATSVDGYGEEGDPLPDNWKALTPDEDKILAINDLLFAEIIEPEAENVVAIRRRSWGGAGSTKTIKLRAYCDGREVETEHVLKAKTAAEVMAYDRIKAGIRLTKSGVQLKPQMKQKAELYDRLISAVKGYAGGLVPLHHKALVISAYFDQDAESVAKK